MRNKVILIFSLLILCQTVNVAFADSSKIGTTTATFLKIENGTRPVGMGGAYVALSDDVNAVYWNPAGLMQINTSELTMLHTVFWTEKIYLEYLAYAAPIDLKKKKFAYGISVIYLGTDDIDRRTSTGQSDGKAKVANYSIAGSLSWEIRNNVGIGVTVKNIQMNLDKEKGSTVAVDVGIINKFIDNLSIGIMLQNLGSKINISDTSEKLPTNVKAGLAYKMFNNSLILAGDIDMPNDRDAKFHIGTEYQVHELFALRAGFENISSPGNYSGITAGVSVKEESIDEVFNVNNIQFDYAWLYLGDLGSMHHVSLSVKF